MPIRVQDQSTEVAAMAQSWPIAEALLGGTAAMRRAGHEFLPRWPNEEQGSYDARICTATLFPAFGRTVGVMAGKPFSKQLTLSDDVPPEIVEHAENIDLEGRNLHTFASDVMTEALAYGLCGVLVDYPETRGMVRTVADQNAIGARPYFVFIKHGQILGWQTERINGVLKLVQLRIAEIGIEQDGPYGAREIRRVRVLMPGAWELWQEGEKREDEYQLISGGTSLSEIPFVPFYGDRRAFMHGTSPLIDLAYQNVKHWQSSSDQDTILHVARVPILVMIGADDQTGLTVGASTAVKLPIGADLKFVEHTGAAIGAGEKAIQALEAQMIQTGAELLVSKPGQRTATEASNDADANKSELQRITESFEDGLDQCLQYHAMWMGLPDGGHVELFKDFSSGSLTDASGQLILSMQQGGLISKDTALMEFKRRGTLSAEVESSEEQDKIAEQGPELGMVGA